MICVTCMSISRRQPPPEHIESDESDGDPIERGRSFPANLMGNWFSKARDAPHYMLQSATCVVCKRTAACKICHWCVNWHCVHCSRECRKCDSVLCQLCYGGEHGVSRHQCEEPAAGKEWTSDICKDDIRRILHKRIDKVLNWRDMPVRYRDEVLFSCWQGATIAGGVRRDNVVRDGNEVRPSGEDEGTYVARCWMCKEILPLSLDCWSNRVLKDFRGRVTHPKDKPYRPELCSSCSKAEEEDKRCPYACSSKNCGVQLTGGNSSKLSRSPEFTGVRLCSICIRRLDAASAAAHLAEIASADHVPGS